MSHNNDTRISFHRAEGESIILGSGALGDKLILIKGSQGLGIGPMSFASSPIPTGNGSIMRGSRIDEREIFIPILVDCQSPNELNNTLDHLQSVLSPFDERDLTVRVKNPGRDDWREMRVWYSGGLEDAYGDTYRGKYTTVGLRFKAVDATWRGKPTSITKRVDGAVKPFLSDDPTVSFFPVVLSDGVVDGQMSFNITGNAPTYPKWRITGPGQDLNIVHVTSGKTFTLEGLIEADDPITIDMENGTVTSVLYPNYELHTRVPLSSRHFKMNPGVNDIEFVMVGATEGSEVSVTYQPRWLGGH